jgi:hypothetical protein
MDTRAALLLADIERECAQLKALVEELRQMGRLTGSASRVEVRAAAGILHDFYTGAERLFARVAAALDGEVPKGEGWHQQLLGRMATPVEAVRPAVIDESLRRDLMEYLRFRHLFRNLYGFELETKRVVELAAKLPGRWQRLRNAVDQFVLFLRELE